MRSPIRPLILLHLVPRVALLVRLAFFWRVVTSDPRNRAAWLLACVMSVFVLESSKCNSSRRKISSWSLISCISAFGPMIMYNPARFSQEEQRNRARSIHNDRYLDAFWGVFHVKNVGDVSRSQSCVLLFTWLATLREHMKDTTTVFSFTLHTFSTFFTSRDIDS
jgi:hypothetical protein